MKANKTIVLPQGLIKTMSAIREAGELCEVDRNKPDSWNDDTVLFEPPFELCFEDVCHYVYDPEAGDPARGVEPWTSFAHLPGDWVCPYCRNSKDKFTQTSDKRYRDSGFAVVWRGDIPSLPLPVNLIEYAKDFAKRLWRPVLGSGVHDFDVPIPVPVGEAIQLGVERLEDWSNALLGFINKPGGLSVRLAFLSSSLDTSNFRVTDGDVTGLSTEKAADNATYFTDALEPGKTGVAGKVVRFICNPQADPFTLQLHAIISGKITLLGHELNIPESDIPIGPS